MKLLNILQPLIDHLYIFQLLEYQSPDLLQWFIKHPFKRHLQKKQHLDLTLHIKVLLTISLILIGTSAYVLSAGISSFLLLFILFLQISPIFIVISELLFKPLEAFQRNRIVSRAIAKRKTLPNLKVIAIVGSYAKTSTKNMLYTLLWKDFNVVKTPKSYNTELSIAGSILSDLKESTEIYIVEMDAYHEGEISRLCQIAQPNLGIITAIGPQHLERFGSIENLASTQFELGEYLERENKRISELADHSAKTEVFDSLSPKDVQWTSELSGRGGRMQALFLNRQDDWSQKLANPNQNIVWYNNEENKITNRKETETHQSFTLQLAKEKTEITLPLKGEHNAINFLAAAAIAKTLNLPLNTIKRRALLIKPTEHRLEIRQMGNLILLDNTYNANPKAALSSLELLNSYKESQKILITPGFVELGKDHQKSHEEFAKAAAKVADDIIIVGENAKKPILKGLIEAKFNHEHIHNAESTAKALEHLSKITKQNPVVLLENDLPDQYF